MDCMPVSVRRSSCIARRIRCTCKSRSESREHLGYMQFHEVQPQSPLRIRLISIQALFLVHVRSSLSFVLTISIEAKDIVFSGIRFWAPSWTSRPFKLHPTLFLLTRLKIRPNKTIVERKPKVSYWKPSTIPNNPENGMGTTPALLRNEGQTQSGQTDIFSSKV